MKIKVRVTKLIRYCSGVGRHAWYESNVGPVRKPIQPGMIVPLRAEIKKVSWWRAFVLFIKKIWQRKKINVKGADSAVI